MPSWEVVQVLMDKVPKDGTKVRIYGAENMPVRDRLFYLRSIQRRIERLDTPYILRKDTVKNKFYFWFIPKQIPKDPIEYQLYELAIQRFEIERKAKLNIWQKKTPFKRRYNRHGKLEVEG